MPRLPANQTEAPGSDSFLDVTTNIVGILIILVMVVGMRASRSPSSEPGPEPSIDEKLLGEVESLSAQAAAVTSDIHRLHRQAIEVDRELALQEAGRNRLSLIVAMAEKELHERKAALDGDKRQQLEQQSQAAALRHEISELQNRIAAASAEQKPAVEVKAFFTPISKTVLGKEIHFQLAGGRVAHVPLEDLFDLARDETRAHMTHLPELTNRVMVVGPKQGFEMRYTVEVDIDRRQGQMAVRSNEWEVQPVQNTLGETSEEALADGSNFRRILSLYPPKDTTVTFWTYPDSFAEFRVLQEELHRLGYPTAGRPLPTGHLISGSPRGSKSAGQ